MAVTTSAIHDLELLQAEYDRCARTHPPLFHERVVAWSDRGHELLTAEQWQAFSVLHPEPPPHVRSGWWRWDGPWAISEDEELMGRFTGSPDGLWEFLDLSNTAATLLSEVAPADVAGAGGYDAWLHLLHRTALLYPSMLLEVGTTTWGVGPEQDQAGVPLLYGWRSTGSVRLPTHLLVHRLKYNVFTSSAALLRAILRPERTRTWQDGIEGFPANIVRDGAPGTCERISSTEGMAFPSSGPNLWWRKGGFFEVRFWAGTGPVLIPSRHLGCDHLTRLIESEGRGVHVLQFRTARRASGNRPLASTVMEDDATGTVGSHDTGDPVFPFHFGSPQHEVTLDEEAVAQVRTAIEEARRRVEAAKQTGDRAAEVGAERELRALERHLDRDFDDHGRPRRLGTTQEEKARKAVWCALNEQYTRLRAVGLSELADHFVDSVKWISEARCFAYRPAVPTTWLTEKGSFVGKR